MDGLAGGVALLCALALAAARLPRARLPLPSLPRHRDDPGSLHCQRCGQGRAARHDPAAARAGACRPRRPCATPSSRATRTASGDAPPQAHNAALRRLRRVFCETWRPARRQARGAEQRGTQWRPAAPRCHVACCRCARCWPVRARVRVCMPMGVPVLFCRRRRSHTRLVWRSPPQAASGAERAARAAQPDGTGTGGAGGRAAHQQSRWLVSGGGAAGRGATRRVAAWRRLAARRGSRQPRRMQAQACPVARSVHSLCAVASEAHWPAMHACRGTRQGVVHGIVCFCCSDTCGLL